MANPLIKFQDMVLFILSPNLDEEFLKVVQSGTTISTTITSQNSEKHLKLL